MMNVTLFCAFTDQWSINEDRWNDDIMVDMYITKNSDIIRTFEYWQALNNMNVSINMATNRMNVPL